MCGTQKFHFSLKINKFACMFMKLTVKIYISVHIIATKFIVIRFFFFFFFLLLFIIIVSFVILIFKFVWINDESAMLIKMCIIMIYNFEARFTCSHDPLFVRVLWNVYFFFVEKSFRIQFYVETNFVLFPTLICGPFQTFKNEAKKKNRLIW